MDLTEFQKVFTEHAPCEKGREEFLKCRTRAQAYDMAASPFAYDFLMKSVYEGWGPSTRDMYDTFRPYINGRRTAQYATPDRKVGIQIWCDSEKIEVEDNIRWVILFGCVGRFIVREWQTVKIILDRNSNVTIEGAPNSLIYVENYGGKYLDASGVCRVKNKIEE